MIEIKCESLEELKQLLSLIKESSVQAESRKAKESEVKKVEEAVIPEKEETAEPEQEPETRDSTSDKSAAPKHTLAEVRAVLAEIQKRQGKAVLKSLLDEYDAKAVSKVPEDKLDELYEKAVALNA